MDGVVDALAVQGRIVSHENGWSRLACSTVKVRKKIEMQI